MNALSRPGGVARWMLASPLKILATLLVFLSASGFVAGLTVPELYLYADRFRVSVMALADREVVRVVERRDLQHAGAEGGIDRAVFEQVNDQGILERVGGAVGDA